jgi:hypothetical protein
MSRIGHCNERSSMEASNWSKNLFREHLSDIQWHQNNCSACCELLSSCSCALEHVNGFEFGFDTETGQERRKMFSENPHAKLAPNTFRM